MHLKACWAYKPKGCSGKKHINTHTSEAEIQLSSVSDQAHQPSVTDYY